MRNDSESELEILEWNGLKVDMKVENPDHGWTGTLKRIYQNSHGEVIGVVEVIAGGERHEVDEFADKLLPFDN